MAPPIDTVVFALKVQELTVMEPTTGIDSRRLTTQGHWLESNVTLVTVHASARVMNGAIIAC